MSDFDFEPAKMTLTNLRTGRTREVQFNPTEVSATLDAAYTDIKVLGMSHEAQQFQNTGNLQVPIDLLFDRLTGFGGGGGGQNYMSALNFMRSLLVPARADDVLGGGPPPVLFVWPNLFSFECRVRSLEETHMRFARDLRSTLMGVKLKLHRFRSMRALSEDVERDGFEEKS